MTKPKRAALYLRVSTDRQTVENQTQALTAIAAHRGWEIVGIYSDKGVSGAKGRKDRPEFDRMLTDASRRKFDVVMAFALDRIGRSLSDLLATLTHLDACKVDLFVDRDTIDTTTPTGKLLFHITGAFAEFERGMIVQRVNAGLDRARKAGVTLGRPRIGADDDKAGAKKVDGIKAALAESKAASARGEKGRGLLKIAADFGVGSSTVQRVKREMTAGRAQP